ncbi:MAG: Gfo/Idh/MocA family oxidoreductase [Anaerolineae bacterium]|nr:Gfo/Idh/MocA family oxidoreductase [Anaerolineae bacterium]
MRTIRLGLIGAGGIAQTHCRAIADVEGVEVVAASDVVRENAEKTAARWGIGHVFASYEEMLQMGDLDGVIVCTPTAVHAPPTIAALKAAKHVLCEKPMEATLDAAAEMVRVAHDTGKILMVALKLRYSPQVIVAKNVVDAGTLGEIYYAECVADRRRGNPGGSFIRKATAGFGAGADIGVYALDTALYLMGHPKPVAVSAITSNYISLHSEPVIGQWGRGIDRTEVEDFAAAWVRFENGARLVFKTSWCMHMDSLGGTFFLGTKAGLRVGVGEVRGPEEGVTVYRDEFGAMTDAAVQNVRPVEGIELFRRENAAFADAVREGKPSPIDPGGMLLTNVIIQGVIDSSAAGGKEIEVKVPDVW